MTEVVSPESFASIQELVRGAQADLNEAKDVMMRKARDVRLKLHAISDTEVEAHRLIADAKIAHLDAKQVFRAQQAYVEKMAARVYKLNSLIRQNKIDLHPHKSAALDWAEAHPAYTLDLEQPYKVLVSLVARYIGEVSCIRYIDEWSFVFAPYRCLEMKAIGPFKHLEDALDAATTVTPYEPNAHVNSALGADVTSADISALLRADPQAMDSKPLGTITPALARLNEYDAAQSKGA